MSNFPVPPAVPEPPAPPKGPNGFYLFARMFDEPSMVFKHIVQRPRILAPLVIIVLAVCLRSFAIPDAVLRKQAELGFDAVEKFRPGTITADVRQQALAKAVSFSARAQSAAFGALAGIAGTAVLAVILWGAFSMVGAEITYTQEYSLVLYGGAPFLLGMLVQLALTPVTQSPTFSIGLGFLVPADSSPFLHLLLASFSLFTLWGLYALALGHQIQRKQKSVTGSLMVIGSLWFCFTLVTAYFGAQFGAASFV